MKTGEFFRTYYLIDRIGHGGMSVVHLAFDVRTRRFVALKTLFSDLTNEHDYRRRFEREVAVYQALSHPNIVALVEADVSGSFTYMAQEYVDGELLGDLMNRHPDGLPLTEALRIMEGLTNAVFHAHSRGVIHRDIQPNNVIVTRDGTVKLLDFGIAYTEDSMVSTQTGTIMGTFVYSSPEQNQGKRVDERSDLYSLGLVFYELLTGHRAIKGENLMEITEYQLRQTIPPVRNLRFEVPEELEAIVMRLLERWPEGRYKYARNLIDDLIQMKVTASFQELDLLFGDDVDVRLDTAQKAFNAHRLDKALELVRDVVASRPESGSAHFLMGRILAATGQGEEAAEAFRRALECADERPEYRIEYALTCYRLGREEEAIAQCDMLLAVDGDNKLASGLRAMLLGLRRGGLRVDPVSHELAPASPLAPAPGLENASPMDPGLDLVERFGVLNGRLDRTDPERAGLLSSLFCGLGHFHNGAIRRGLRRTLAALGLLTLAGLLLFSSPSLPLDVYGFLEGVCYQDFVQQARAEHLQEKTDYAVAAWLQGFCSLLAMPVVGGLILLWYRDRQAVMDFHLRRHVYGRICAVYRADLVEMQLPADHGLVEGDRLYVVENDPFASGRSSRQVLGVARVVLPLPTAAVTTFLPGPSGRTLPSAGDLALPADVVDDCCLGDAPPLPPCPAVVRDLAVRRWASGTPSSTAVAPPPTEVV